MLIAWVRSKVYITSSNITLQASPFAPTRFARRVVWSSLARSNSMTDPKPRRVGRPKKSPAEKRIYEVGCWLNEAELAAVDKGCVERNIRRGEFLRSSCLNVLPPVVPAINIKAWRDLARTTANINQIAASLNKSSAAKSVNGRKVMEAMHETLEQVALLRASMLGVDAE